MRFGKDPVRFDMERMFKRKKKGEYDYQGRQVPEKIIRKIFGENRALFKNLRDEIDKLNVDKNNKFFMLNYIGEQLAEKINDPSLGNRAFLQLSMAGQGTFEIEAERVSGAWYIKTFKKW